MRRLALAALVAAAAIGGCDRKRHHPGPAAPPTTSAASDAAASNAPPASASAAAAARPSYADSARPNEDHLLIGAARLTELRKRADAGDPTWRTLKENVDRYMSKPGDDHTGAESIATVALITGEKKYCDAALAFSELEMKDDVRSGQYLYYGDHMREVATVLDACRDHLPDADRRRLVEYLDRWTQELWHDNRGSGWGLDDPGNNYFMAFLEGTAFAGYALLAEGHDNARGFLDILQKKIEGEVLPYLERRGRGGDWHEGVNYGQRAKQRLFNALAVIHTMGGPNYFTRSDFFRDTIHYAIYQLQPDRRSIYPGGDLARSSDMRVTPFDRDYLLMAVRFVEDEKARRHGQWYLDEVMPSMTAGKVPWRQGIHRDFILASPEVKPLPPDGLPLHYHAKGTGWLHVRSGWGTDATSLSISGSDVIDQSHAHFDVGSFTLFKKGWQAIDAVTLSHSGLSWEAGAHNMVHVEGHERRQGDAGRGVLHFEAKPGYAYAQIDASALFRTKAGGDQPMLGEYTRELVYLAPDSLVVLDRVEPKAGVKYHLRMHFADEPRGRDGRYSATHGGGGISYRVVVGKESRIAKDDDLAGGKSDAYRVETRADDGRFLTVAQVATGSPPKLEVSRLQAEGDAIGALLGNQAVVFSAAARGAPISPIRYRAPRKVSAHTIVNLEPGAGYRVTKADKDGQLEIELTPGGDSRASDHGVLRLDASVKDGP